MLTKMYSVFDVKVAAYMQPFFARAHGEAIRSFETACADSNHPFCKNSEDFTLFYVGEFNDETAVLTPDLVPIPLAKANEIVARQVSAA